MKLWFRISIAFGFSLILALLFYLLVVDPNVETIRFRLLGYLFEWVAPLYLGLIVILPFLIFIRSLSLVDMSKGQQALSLVLRSFLVIGLALALARPTMVSKESKTSTVFLVDVSASVSNSQIESARVIVEKAYKEKNDNQIQLITFSSRPRVVTLDQGVPKMLKRHTKENDKTAQANPQTDIQAAIQHAYGLFPIDHIPRIVLFSDGNETQGSALAEAFRAKRRKIKIHVMPYETRKEKEVLIQSLKLPSDVRMGAPFYLKATIFSTHQDHAKLTLYKDNFINGLDGFKKVAIRPGKNIVRFKSLVRDSGFVNYRLVLSHIKNDTWKNNNSATAILPVLGRPKVLYLEGEPIYAGYLKRALEAEKIDVVVRGPYGMPNSVTELSKFDLLIMSDVPAMYVNLNQMAALNSYVRDLGGGFIMTGGQNSFGAGGYYGTRIEKMLPVRFDTEKKRSQPSLALALCIDRSGSMSGQKIELAKDAAKATTELLGANDLISVIAFDSRAHMIVRLQRAANRLRILSDIAQLQSGGGTNIHPCLQEAYTQLHTANAKVKHVILLSDGQSSYSGISQLVDEMASRKITVSAVGVGSGADRTLLQMIAERGNGRFYHTNDATNIPKIFTKETTTVARSALVEELVKVKVAKPANIIKGIHIASAPYLRGYVSTKAKPLADLILVSDYSEPIYAQWRLGLGKTAAFTSDIKNKWAVDWIGWNEFSQFWAQVVRELMRHRISRSFAMSSKVEQGRVHVRVDALDRQDRFINGLNSELSVIDPKHPGKKYKYPLYQRAAGQYQASFQLPRYGAFILRARHKIDQKIVAESINSISIPYPKEYTDLIPNSSMLKELAQSTKGKIKPTLSAMLSSDGETISYRKDLWMWVLYILLGLFFFDVLLRRVRLFGYSTLSIDQFEENDTH